jgi:hypothetical protein
MTRVFTLGRVHRALREFCDDAPEDFTPMTRRLLKGFYTGDRAELEESSEADAANFSAKIDDNKITDLLKKARGYVETKEERKKRLQEKIIADADYKEKKKEKLQRLATLRILNMQREANGEKPLDDDERRRTTVAPTCDQNETDRALLPQKNRNQSIAKVAPMPH